MSLSSFDPFGRLLLLFGPPFAKIGIPIEHFNLFLEYKGV